jgi:hypothetical protein
MKNTPELSAIVDRIAQLKAQISDLTMEEAALKAALIESGLEAVNGSEHRAAISWTFRKTTDWRSIAEKFDPSRQLIAAHTTAGEPYPSVRLFARKQGT